MPEMTRMEAALRELYRLEHPPTEDVAMSASTYRADLYYINLNLGGGTRSERVIGPAQWWLYRLQFWRFRKLHGFHVLRED